MSESATPPAGRTEGRATSEDVYVAAAALQRLGPAQRAAVFRRLPPDCAELVFDRLDAALQEELLRGPEDGEVRRLVEAMDPDDQARMFAEMPPAVVRRALAELSPRERELTNQLLAYPAESAGRGMSPEFVPLSPDLRAAESLDVIRARGLEAATVYALPVTDTAGRLRGMVQLRDLVLAAPDVRVGRLMDPAGQNGRGAGDYPGGGRS